MSHGKTSETRSSWCHLRTLFTRKRIGRAFLQNDLNSFSVHSELGSQLIHRLMTFGILMLFALGCRTTDGTFEIKEIRPNYSKVTHRTYKFEKIEFISSPIPQRLAARGIKRLCPLVVTTFDKTYERTPDGNEIYLPEESFDNQTLYFRTGLESCSTPAGIDELSGFATAIPIIPGDGKTKNVFNLEYEFADGSRKTIGDGTYWPNNPQQVSVFYSLDHICWGRDCDLIVADGPNGKTLTIEKHNPVSK